MRLVMAVMRDVHEAIRGHDVWILTAGVTFYALLSGVPSLVVAVRETAAASRAQTVCPRVPLAR